MKREMAVMLTAIAVLGVFDPALSAAAPTDAFEQVAIVPAPRSPHRLAYACLVAGVGLVGASFILSDRADRAYDRYLAAAAPEEIEHQFDSAVHYDRWASGSLLGGETLISAGLYLRFLRRPSSPRLSLLLDARRCAVSLRF